MTSRKSLRLNLSLEIELAGIACFFILNAFLSQALGQASHIFVAHRGGVVNEQFAENSLGALEEAIKRGYTHVEVDARITADGHVVCFHNDALMEEAGIDGNISELPLDSVKNIVLKRSGEKIPTFEAYVARCAGRIGIMVDLKGCKEEFIERYAQEIEAALRKHQLLSTAYILINKTPKNNQEKIVQYFMGKAKISWRTSAAETQDVAANDPDFSNKYYVFNHGADFGKQEIRAFQKMGLQVIVSINTGHYRSTDAQKQGTKHLKKMLKWKADGVQIDSVYDTLLFKKKR